MFKVLFLDDMQDRHIEFMKICIGLDIDIQPVWNAKDAIKYLKKNEYKIAFLDHDLEIDHYSDKGQTKPVIEDTGAEVAEFISQMEKPPEIVVVHSYNAVGRKRIIELLAKTNSHITVYDRPFGMVGGDFARLVEKLAGNTDK